MKPRDRELDPDAARLIGALVGSKPDPAYAELQRAQDYRAVFLGSEPGKRVLADLMETLGLFKAAFDGDALRMARAVGRQDAAKEILGRLTAEPRVRPDRANSRRAP